MEHGPEIVQFKKIIFEILCQISDKPNAGKHGEIMIMESTIIRTFLNGMATLANKIGI